MQEKEEALLSAYEAVRLPPSNPNYVFSLAAAYHETGSLQEALEVYKSLVEDGEVSTELRAR